MRRSRPLILIFIILVGVFIFWQVRRQGEARETPLVALCPGPDRYGYTCEPGDSYAYIDATEDTFLYADDATLTIDLPFPFTFYGEEYSDVTLSVNGNLQFASQDAHFFNECLEQGPVTGMGAMIAPYWDDLDLTVNGYLETTVQGDAPDRIFVIEWDDVPYYGEDATVTFEVQLFETSNDIVFLYQDVSQPPRNMGRAATIGLQSEMHGAALQYSCNTPSVSDTRGILVPHPETAGNLPDTESSGSVPSPVQVKHDVDEVISTFQEEGTAGLQRLQLDGLTANPPRYAQWQLLDINGDGSLELIWLWRGDRNHPEMARLLILGGEQNMAPELLYDLPLSSRDRLFHLPYVAGSGDASGDGIADLLIQDSVSGNTSLVTVQSGPIEAIAGPATCSLATLADIDSNGVLELALGDCPDGQRQYHRLQDMEWSPLPPK